LEDFYRKILAEYKIQTTPLCTTIPDILNATTEALLDIKDLDADSMTALAVLAKKAGIKVHSKTSLLSYGTLVKSSFTA
jgi:hypothetical protein